MTTRTITDTPTRPLDATTDLLHWSPDTSTPDTPAMVESHAPMPPRRAPRLPLRRRRRAWSWWEVLAFLGIVALIVALVVEPLKTLVTVAAASIPAYVIAVAHRKAAER